MTSFTDFRLQADPSAPSCWPAHLHWPHHLQLLAVITEKINLWIFHVRNLFSIFTIIIMVSILALCLVSVLWFPHVMNIPSHSICSHLSLIYLHRDKQNNSPEWSSALLKQQQQKVHAVEQWVYFGTTIKESPLSHSKSYYDLEWLHA